MAEIKNEGIDARKRIESSAKKWNDGMIIALVIAIILSLLSFVGLIVTRLYLYTGH